ncbi:MAG TPA: elongation factor G [Chloroflexota bacterium]|nr:elongation factor G [Chloroflexota bacterium]
MKSYATENLRNVALVSHEGAGKTSLVEAALFDTGVTSRLGRVEDGTTVSDFEPDEKERQISLATALVPVEWRDCKINFLDTPGYPDFIGELRGALRVADTALVLIDATGGVEVGTEMAWSYVGEYHLPRMIFVNRLDREHTDFFATLEVIQSRLSKHTVALQIPIGAQAEFKGVVDVLSGRASLYEAGKRQEGAVPADLEARRSELREKLVEAICETDDDLITQFLEGEEIAEADLRRALRAAVISGALIPVLCGSATANIGIADALDAVVDLCPSPADMPPTTDASGKPVDGHLAALVFKTVADPFGRRSYFRVYGGVMKADSHVWNTAHAKDERIAQLLVMRGNHGEPVGELAPGDIGAVLKLTDTLTGETLATKEHPLVLPPITYPEPAYSASVEPKTRADLDKLGQALSRLTQEDPTLRVVRDAESAQTILSGMGETHLQVAMERLHRKYQVDVTLGEPRVPYRETVTASSRAQGRHKKQTGGHGQFGDVWMTVAPLPRGEGYRFVDKIVGGAIPRNFIPAVEKGVQEAMREGLLAGYPVVDVEVTIDDGSYHPVDSSEMAFKLAGSLAFKKAAEGARPIILEPIMRVDVRVPNEFTGDVMSDFNSKRARILGMEPVSESTTLIQAQVPMREMTHYSAALRSITQGRGVYTMRMEGYEEAPPNVAQQIIAEAQAENHK